MYKEVSNPGPPRQVKPCIWKEGVRTILLAGEVCANWLNNTGREVTDGDQRAAIHVETLTRIINTDRAHAMTGRRLDGTEQN